MSWAARQVNTMPQCIVGISVAQNAANASMSAFSAEFITHHHSSLLLSSSHSASPPTFLRASLTSSVSHSLLSHFKLPVKSIVRSRSHGMPAFPRLLFFSPTLCVMERPRFFSIEDLRMLDHAGSPPPVCACVYVCVPPCDVCGVVTFFVRASPGESSNNKVCA